MYNWLKKLIDVTYDVDDECKTDAALRCSSRILTPCSGYTIKEFMTGSVPYFFCSQPTSLSRCTIAKRVQSFIHRFDEIAKQRSQFHLNPYVTAADVQLGSRQLRETTSYADEPAVYGRDEDMDYIVNLLLNDADGNDREERDVSVCAIVGMGGLGKTTLAQKVYHDIRSTDYFEVKCWICVSDNFNPKIFVKTILESLGDEVAHDKHTMDLLQSRLQKRLDGKRFLVVLDDVSSEDQGPWETLRTSLCCGRKDNEEFEFSFLETMLRIREFRLVPSFYKFNHPSTFLGFIFSNLKCLCVLTLAGLTLRRFPNSIGKLKHLRYLNLSGTNIKLFPKDVCCLINLQILKLHDCFDLRCLPADMRKMTNLRHYRM
ncbi:hypothetical protein C5167_044230 [Papaver somniferum]|uniref:Uncharacterized protein n=1 Tax=Papaver somniferum TaxID=3469 RepID=A0A4Y7LBI5_PAPSO|nr:hypothetical protein C5167_044230 [Papaver somniferum]